jgi:hypothetical protein
MSDRHIKPPEYTHEEKGKERTAVGGISPGSSPMFSFDPMPSCPAWFEPQQ